MKKPIKKDPEQWWLKIIQDFDWYKTMKSSDFIVSPNYLEMRKRKIDEFKVDESDFIAFIRETLKYKEVTDYLVHGKGFLMIIHYYQAYVAKKYGNHGDFLMYGEEAIKKLSTGQWSGFATPEFREYLQDLINRNVIKERC